MMTAENIISGRSISETSVPNPIIIRARIRRKKEEYRRKVAVVMALFIMMTLATFTLSIKSLAFDKKSDVPSYKYYTTYTVKSGDSLNTIAAQYITAEYTSTDKYISEIVSINHLASASEICAGQEIIIPYYDSVVKR